MTTKEYLSLDPEKDKDKIIEFNRNLTEKYPFLIPHSAWTGEVVKDYDYTWTDWDCLNKGWRIAFGDQMLEELREELIKFNFLNKYRLVEVKEKYGTLRVYDLGHPAGSKIYDIISKYEKLSADVCIDCGKPHPEYTSLGWISYYCEDCARDIADRNKMKLEDYFEKLEGEEE